MWPGEIAPSWEEEQERAVRSTDLALRLLERTQELIGNGEFWRADSLALTFGEEACDPLSDRAFYFSLGGAAARARWEMREELADSGVSPLDVKQVMNAVFQVTRDYQGEPGGWKFAHAVLDGMRSALGEYRATQVLELAEGEQPVVETKG